MRWETYLYFILLRLHLTNLGRWQKRVANHKKGRRKRFIHLTKIHIEDTSLIPNLFLSQQLWSRSNREVENKFYNFRFTQPITLVYQLDINAGVRHSNITTSKNKENQRKTMNRNYQTRKGKDNQRQRKHDEHRRPNVRNEKEQSRKEISLYHKEPKEKRV